jgi:hypothetical protein
MREVHECVEDFKTCAASRLPRIDEAVALVLAGKATHRQAAAVAGISAPAINRRVKSAQNQTCKHVNSPAPTPAVDRGAVARQAVSKLDAQELEQFRRWFRGYVRAMAKGATP